MRSKVEYVVCIDTENQKHVEYFVNIKLIALSFSRPERNNAQY